MTKAQRINAAIDALAALYENGLLLASVMPDELLMQAVEEIKASREEHKKAQP